MTITLVSILMVVTPQVAETLMFVYSADAYCLAMLLAVLAVYYIYKENSLKNNILAISFIVLTLSLYQAYISVIVSLCILLPIINLIQGEDWKNILKIVGKSLTIGIVGMILYYGITLLILKLSNNGFSIYGGANNIGVSTIQNLIPETLNTYKTFYKYFFREDLIYNEFWRRDIINFIIAIITIVNIICIIIKNKTYKKYNNIMLLCLFIIILPIGINIINIIAPDRDNNLVMGMSYVLIYVLVLKIIDILDCEKEYKILKSISQVFLSIIIVTFVLSNNASYMARKEVYNNYYSTSMRILTKIENYGNYNENTPVLIGGIIKHSPNIAKLGNGFISNDYETWNNYSGIEMINKFFHNYMGMTINLCNKTDYEKIVKSEEYKNMSIFPYDECIKMIDGILVVKIEDSPAI